MARRQTLLLLLIGTLITVCIGVAVSALVQARGTAVTQRVYSLRSDADIAAIARRVFRLEKPTTKELNSAVIVSLKSCQKDDACRRSFMDAAPHGRAGKPGKAGKMGPVGAAGRTGPAGKAGKTGPAGPAGRRGPTGARGPTGPDGAQGRAGNAGASVSVNDVLAALCRRAPALGKLICG